MTTDTTGATSLDLALTRIVDAPRGLVLKAGTDPAELLRRWGLNGSFTQSRKHDHIFRADETGAEFPGFGSSGDAGMRGRIRGQGQFVPSSQIFMTNTIFRAYANGYRRFFANEIK